MKLKKFKVFGILLKYFGIPLLPLILISWLTCPLLLETWWITLFFVTFYAIAYGCILLFWCGFLIISGKFNL